MQDWNDPQLSDGDMPIRMKNAINNIFPDMEIQKEIKPQSHTDELNDYLRMLADMDTVSIHRKFFLLQSYIDMMRNRINEL